MCTREPTWYSCQLDGCLAEKEGHDDDKESWGITEEDGPPETLVQNVGHAFLPPNHRHSSFQKKLFNLLLPALARYHACF